MTDPIYRPGPIDGVSVEERACIPQTGVLHAYVWWAAQTTHAPPWWHVGAGLTAFASEAARCGYELGDGDDNKSCLWVSLVGPSAAGKTTSINRLTDFYTAYLEPLEVAKPFIQAEGSLPGMFATLTDKYDHEADHTLGLLVQDELTRLLDTKQPITEMLMQIADGRQIERHLKKEQERRRAGQQAQDVLRNPKISALFATTHSNLRRVSKAHHADAGLYSRMLWFIGAPNPAALKLLPDTCPAERRCALEQWRDWQQWQIAEYNISGNNRITFPAEVLAILEHSLFEKARKGLESPDRLAAAKLRGITQAYKIAALFALSQKRTTVWSEDMDCAVNLVERCQGDYALHIDPEIGVSETMIMINRAFLAIRQKGQTGLPRTQLYKVLKAAKYQIDDVVATLLDEGSVEEVKTQTRGRPAKRYIALGPERFTRTDATDATVIPINSTPTVDTAKGDT